MHTPIPPKLLHKSSSEDVLITDAAVPLPEYLDGDAVERCGAQLRHLLALYIPHEAGGLRFSGFHDARFAGRDRISDKLHDGTRWLRLRAVPYQIARPTLETAGMQTASLKEDAATLVDALAWPGRSSAYTFLNDASHYFFYRKTHDHVPGIMLVEAQRQAIYHHLYSNSAWVLGQVTVSLNNLQANFYDYANLMYPIEIIVDDLAAVPSQRPRKIRFRVSFYQRAKLIAVIDTDATVIAIDNFKLIRNTFMHAGEWFTPIDNLISCKVSRLAPDEADGSALSVKLSAVSKTGLRFEAAEGQAPLFGEMRVQIANSDGKTFSAKAILETVKQRESSWRFKDTKSDDLLMLGMIIAGGCVSAEPATAR